MFTAKEATKKTQDAIKEYEQVGKEVEQIMKEAENAISKAISNREYKTEFMVWNEVISWANKEHSQVINGVVSKLKQLGYEAYFKRGSHTKVREDHEEVSVNDTQLYIKWDGK